MAKIHIGIDWGIGVSRSITSHIVVNRDGSIEQFVEGGGMTRTEIVAALDAEVDRLDESMQLAWLRIRHLALSGEHQDGIYSRHLGKDPNTLIIDDVEGP